jgi:hypothetical protein
VFFMFTCWCILSTLAGSIAMQGTSTGTTDRSDAGDKHASYRGDDVTTE